MARRNYNPDQKAEMGLLESIHLEKVTRKAKIRQEIEDAMRDRLVEIELRESMQANACLNAGVSKTDIGRAVGTANFETIKNMLARTKNDKSSADFVPASEWAQYVEYQPHPTDPGLSRMLVTFPVTGEQVHRTVEGQHPRQEGVMQPPHSAAFDVWFQKNWVALVDYMKEISK